MLKASASSSQTDRDGKITAIAISSMNTASKGRTERTIGIIPSPVASMARYSPGPTGGVTGLPFRVSSHENEALGGTRLLGADAGFAPAGRGQLVDMRGKRRRRRNGFGCRDVPVAPQQQDMAYKGRKWSVRKQA